MQINSCPKCGRPGAIFRYYKNVGGVEYGPYLVVQHYAGKTRRGSTRNTKCSISLKKLHPIEEARISRLLAQEKVREKKRR